MQRERSFVEPNFVETFKPPQVQIMTASSPSSAMVGSPAKMSERLEEKVAVLQVRYKSERYVGGLYYPNFYFRTT